MDATEQADVLADGHAACARLAAQEQWRPHAFAVRDVSASHGAQASAAVQAWRAAGTRTVGACACIAPGKPVALFIGHRRMTAHSAAVTARNAVH
nr:hypothetical protein [Xanthomonas arboricola]